MDEFCMDIVRRRMGSHGCSLLARQAMPGVIDIPSWPWNWWPVPRAGGLLGGLQLWCTLFTLLWCTELFEWSVNFDATDHESYLETWNWTPWVIRIKIHTYTIKYCVYISICIFNTCICIDCFPIKHSDFPQPLWTAIVGKHCHTLRNLDFFCPGLAHGTFMDVPTSSFYGDNGDLIGIVNYHNITRKCTIWSPCFLS